MFTGIIETIGRIGTVQKEKDNLLFSIASSISASLQIDQSVSHNGVCLTVVKVKDNIHWVEAVAETLSKTNLADWRMGDAVNLERALSLEQRLDGHLVQGHIDTTGQCTARLEKEGSTEFTFIFSEKFAPLIIEKGSVAVNGISLTAFNVERNKFSVAIIPYTNTHTTMQYLKEGMRVNLEFDLIGKYVLRSASLQ